MRLRRQFIVFKIIADLICAILSNFLCCPNFALAERNIPFEDSPNNFLYLGSYSNMEYTEEHQYGFEVDLWKVRNTLSGHFLHSEGLVGDTPIGLLTNIQFSPSTGELSFETELTIGIHFCKDHKYVPSKNRYEFHGKLKENELTGILTERDGLHSNKIIRTQKIKLDRDEEKEMLLKDIKTFKDWENYSNAILNRRGPK